MTTDQHLNKMLNERYRILETLGRGGFGETYLAEDTHMPSGRKCVLKQLKPIVEQPQIPLWMKERFQREAAILEELGEGNSQIPRLYAYFSQEEKFYLVQEWIQGETLAQKWQREGNLNSQEVKNLLVQLLPVLDYVHSRRIVHRDVKPENIILRQSDRLPVLIDFGAVKEAVSTTIDTSSSSAFSASIGTPGYMPSEQAAGRPVYSSDLYGLGLTALFLLTGKPPHELETDSRTGEIVWQHHATTVDANLIAVLDKAIKFHPRDRFASATEMLSALGTKVTTKATIQVAPGVSSDSNNSFVGTVAHENPTNNRKTGNNWLVKIFLSLLLLTGLGAGVFLVGVNLLANLWESSFQTSPQAKVDPSSSKPVIFPPITEETPTDTSENAPEIPETEETDSETQPFTEEPSNEPEIPQIVIETKPGTPSQTQTTNQPTPETEINVPILSTGISETQLVSTLGKPTSERNDWQENSRILEYRDVVPGQVNFRYKSDSEGKIQQSDIVLNQSISLGAMQETLNKMLGGNAPSAVKEKLRLVYNRQTKFSFFKVGNLEGKVERDSKDRVMISVWESGQ